MHSSFEEVVRLNDRLDAYRLHRLGSLNELPEASGMSAHVTKGDYLLSRITAAAAL
jgi:hypothetical protein